ncbi:MAG: 50S ribosomal protein L21 [Spirochaetae bacterium HGW-Spirochaetae-3]|jgi:large subunit ribosomal protein L21|nr:MAG: 50S ribosomal protein L21 [Spirochaetae bacterium HGW-Spirochaetae-3]
MYAVVEVQGKQYRAEKGAVIRVDRMDGDAGTPVAIDSVLLVSGDTIKIGAPYVKGAQVKATIKAQEKGDKVIVFKYKSKKDYRRTQGHRQRYTLLTVEDIVGA